jgi:F-type H+-transporting ATPase subunit c
MKKCISFAVPFLVVLLLTPAMGLAEDGTAGSSAAGWIAIASALAIGLAAVAGATAQGRALAAAFEAIGRNPSASGNLFVPMLIGLVFIEVVVILSFVIAFLLQGLAGA